MKMRSPATIGAASIDLALVNRGNCDVPERIARRGIQRNRVAVECVQEQAVSRQRDAGGRDIPGRKTPHSAIRASDRSARSPAHRDVPGRRPGRCAGKASARTAVSPSTTGAPACPPRWPVGNAMRSVMPPDAAGVDFTGCAVLRRLREAYAGSQRGRLSISRIRHPRSQTDISCRHVQRSPFATDAALQNRP